MTGSRRYRGPLLVAALAGIAVLAAAGCARKMSATAPEFEPIHNATVEPGVAGAEPRFVEVPADQLPVLDLAMPDTTQPQPYVIAAGDKLEISVYGDPDLTRQIPVRPDGKISFTFVGDVQAAGRSIEDLRDDLTKRLSAYLRNPEVTVIAQDFGAQKVYAGGELTRPGLFYLTPRENTLLDVVYLAGLPTEKADVSRAVLVRDGHMIPVDFANLLRGDFTDNVVLRDNDLIHFPEMQERYIYVLGEVNRPSAVETTTPRSLVNILATAGGPDPSYAKVKEIAVLRGGFRNPKVAIVNYKELVRGDLSQNIEIRPGDIVYVPTTALGTYSRFIEQILRTFSLLFQARVVREGF